MKMTGNFYRRDLEKNIYTIIKYILLLYLHIINRYSITDYTFFYLIF